MTFAENELQKIALERYKKICPDEVESLVSCSDDFTLFLWRSNQNKSVTRMTGHQNVVNDVKFSPDTKYVIHSECILICLIILLNKIKNSFSKFND